MPRQRQPNATPMADAEDLRSSRGNARVSSTPTPRLEIATNNGQSVNGG